MKAARIRVTKELLEQLLTLPCGGRIESVFQDQDDLANRTVSFVIVGSGQEIVEGMTPPVMSLVTVAGSFLIEAPDGSFETRRSDRREFV